MPTLSPLERLKQSRSQVVVTFSPEEVTRAENEALSKLADKVNIPGFRVGKAPPEMVKGRVKEEALLEETIRALLPTALDSALKDSKVEPILPPRVEIRTKSPLAIALIFVERPPVKVKSLDLKALKKTEPKYDDKDIDRMVQYMLDQYRTTEVVDRAAENGDQVTMHFVGTDEAGQEIPGTRSTNYPVVVGSKSLIPGFEDNLLGLKKGDKKTFQLTFPEKYHAENLRGKPVTFAVDVQQIEKVSTPALTPEFVKEKQLGDSPEDVRKRISDSMKEEEERMERQRREQLLFDTIRSATQIDLAPELVEEEVRTLVKELQTQLEQQNLSVEDWMKRTNRTPESVDKELHEEAEKRVTLRFGVQQLMEDKEIQLTPEEEKSALQDRLNVVPEEQRVDAAKYFGPGGDGYEEVKWVGRVKKLVGQMLA